MRSARHGRLEGDRVGAGQDLCELETAVRSGSGAARLVLLQARVIDAIPVCAVIALEDIAWSRQAVDDERDHHAPQWLSRFAID